MPSRPCFSIQNVLQNVAVHVSQPHATTAETKRQLRMIHAKEMQHRGVEVMHFDFVLDRFVSELVGRSVGVATLYSAARHPEREAERVVISPVGTLCEWRAAKLSRPDDEGGIEQSSLFQIVE